jgi:O-antigen ligase
MEHSALSFLPLILVFVALAYAAIVGEKLHSATGAVSVLGIAATLVGLILGWLLQRFLPAARSVDEWVNYRSIRIDVALLFLGIAAMTFIAVALVRGDLRGRDKPGANSAGRLRLLVPLFLFAVGIAARGKIAAWIAGLMEKSGS